MVTDKFIFEKEVRQLMREVLYDEKPAPPAPIAKKSVAVPTGFVQFAPKPTVWKDYAPWCHCFDFLWGTWEYEYVMQDPPTARGTLSRFRLLLRGKQVARCWMDEAQVERMEAEFNESTF